MGGGGLAPMKCDEGNTMVMRIRVTSCEIEQITLSTKLPFLPQFRMGVLKFSKLSGRFACCNVASSLGVGMGLLMRKGLSE